MSRMAWTIAATPFPLWKQRAGKFRTFLEIGTAILTDAFGTLFRRPGEAWRSAVRSAAVC